IKAAQESPIVSSKSQSARFLVLLAVLSGSCNLPAESKRTSEIHVYPGEEIQAALDQAASDSTIDTVVVHEGTYAPAEPRQALVWFNQRHDGIHFKAEGNVTLTAANANVAKRGLESYPAVVNHVVYFGDGVTDRTRISGFTITGANNFVTTDQGPTIQPNIAAQRLEKTAFFYTNGGGIKIFGRSYPVLEDLEVVDNFASPGGAGVCIEQRGYNDDPVVIRDCRFRNNRSPLTGSAINLLGHEFGSAVKVENCLFENNLSNCPLDDRSRSIGTWKPDIGHGAVTVFAFSKADFARCTFVGNRNGIDDLSKTSTYRDCIFWENNVPGGWANGKRYDTDLVNPKSVEGCYLSMNDYQLDARKNMLQSPDPKFDRSLSPQNSAYASVGYRPLIQEKSQSKSASGEPSRNVEKMFADPLTVDIRGEDFSWSITYSGDVIGELKDITVRRHLYVPVGTRVLLKLQSKDYLYQLALPEQSVREIAVPGMTHQCSFTADQVGVYPLVGDQFCGYSHPDLIGKLIVKDQSEFKEWLTNQD
ncbi:MAG: right-handed parallel beta-helix repeat-containing protein, partial [Planctomycetota bacterium]